MIDGSGRSSVYSTPASLSPPDSTTIIRFLNSAMVSQMFSSAVAGDGPVWFSSSLASPPTSMLSSMAPSYEPQQSSQQPQYYDEDASGSGNSSQPLEQLLPTCPNFVRQKMSLMLLRFSLSGVFLSIVCLLGFFSNLAAFMVLFSSKKFNQSVYIYMKCLAFNDSVMLLTFLVFSLYALTFLPSTPPEIYLMATNTFVSIYRFWFALAIMCQGQSIWFMSLITLDRCFALSSNFYIRDAVCRKCVAIVLSSISFGVWFSFFLVNTFLYQVEPFCIYPDTGGQVMQMYLSTEFAADSWRFRVTFAIIMKFVLPVLLTVVCISYSTAILIHTISSTAAANKKNKTGSNRLSKDNNTNVNNLTRSLSANLPNRNNSMRASVTTPINPKNKNGLQLTGLKKSSRKDSAGGLVETDQIHKMTNNPDSDLNNKNGKASNNAPRGSIHEPLQSQNSSVHGGRLRTRIQTAHALSWAIAASMIFCHLPASSMLLVSELTNYRIAGELWFSVANEIANVLISSSSAINFLLFFFSGAKYRAEMSRLVERIKVRLGRSKGPPARYRCYNYEAGVARHNSLNLHNNANNNGTNKTRISANMHFFGGDTPIEDIHFTRPGTMSPCSLNTTGNNRQTNDNITRVRLEPIDDVSEHPPSSKNVNNNNNQEV